MKKLITTFIVLALLITPMISTQAANSITERLSGRLLLQVQDGGRIWWVNPQNNQKYEITFADAMDLFRSHALGISNNDLSKIKINVNSVGTSPDSDQDGYKDREEILSGNNPFGKGKQATDKTFSKKMAGKMLLQVEDRGRVWYTDPVTLIMHEVKFATLVDMFRGLALGITDEDLSQVGEVGGYEIYKNSEYGFILEFPSGWTDKVVNKIISNWGANGTADGVVFGFPEQNNVFIISVYTKEQWDNIIAEDGPKPKYINQKDNYVFGYSIAHEALSDRVGQQSEYIDQIISTFRFYGLNCGIGNEFISTSLGISFCYPKEVGGNFGKVKQIGNKVYVSVHESVENGQFVKVFEKNKNDSLKVAIEKTFLDGYSSDKCWVEDTGIKMQEDGSIVSSALAYLVDNDGDYFWKNAEDCPIDYARMNGIRYFYTHEGSDKFLFFDIGQYEIELSDGRLWQDSIQILD